jgi:hypothetical protein
MENDSFHLPLIIVRPMTAEAENKSTEPRSDSPTLPPSAKPRPPAIRIAQPHRPPPHFKSPRPCVAPRMLLPARSLRYSPTGSLSCFRWLGLDGDRPLAASDGAPACRRIAPQVRPACLCAISQSGFSAALDWLARARDRFLAPSPRFAVRPPALLVFAPSIHRFQASATTRCQPATFRTPREPNRPE